MTSGSSAAAGGGFGLATPESSSFARFYDATAGAAYSLALRITGTAPAAETACEAAYLDLWSESPPNAFQAPLPALTDRLMELVRARALSTARPPTESVQTPPPPPAYTVAATVRSAIAALNPSCRQALELACFGGMSVAAIAQLTGEPTMTVRASLREALLSIGALTKDEEMPR